MMDKTSTFPPTPCTDIAPTTTTHPTHNMTHCNRTGKQKRIYDADIRNTRLCELVEYLMV